MIGNEDCKKKCDEIYIKFRNMNIEVLYDDRDCSIGKKLSDNELIGIPYQLIIGIRDLKENLIEFKDRLNNDSKKMSLDEVINLLKNKLTIS